MTLAAGCPRCAAPVSRTADRWSCRDHGPTTPLWRPAAADYDSFAEHVARAGTMPTYAPWPLLAGWTVTDFGCVVADGAVEARACCATCSGPSDPDGVVEVTVVSEEPGVGLGARCAGVRRTDPGADIGEGPPHARVRVDGHQVSLWYLMTSDEDDSLDRAVFVGEAHGRWLWLVLQPASAALLLKDEWFLTDLGQLGPGLVELQFGGAPPAW
jgi:hypothetical protein